MSASLAIGGLGLAVLWSGAVLTGVRISGGISQYVASGTRRYLLPPRSGTTLDAHVVHGLSDWERMLNTLRLTVPRAVCGQIPIADPNSAPTPTDRPDVPLCPRCVSRARWIVGTAVAAPLGSR